ncbi:TetR/AcrR family transcriptional regulator [Spongiibacter sp.]|uniref:TetR/AcrR family transcriptional regulator n=1 Tax=Spongiibacter sp. TaxID=2024860 RepID=UPI003562C658
MKRPISTLAQGQRIAADSELLPPAVTPKGAKGKVLNAALQLFAQAGYGATSVRDICKAAKVQTTTLYSHFPSKEHVLAEIIGLGYAEHYKRIKDALAASADEPLARLAAVVRAHVISHCEYPMLAVVANTESHFLSPELAESVVVTLQQSETVLAEILLQCQEAGVFDVPDIYLALRAIGGMGMRVAFWYEPGCGMTPQHVADTYAEFALRLVGAGKPSPSLC